jgi:uncharacterized membrane protein YraQ (UPF0718 family)
MHGLALVGQALWMSLTMLWQIFWGLNLGFLLSALIEVTLSRDDMSSLLPDARPRSLAIAGLLGAASSSCSYAAVAMGRSIVRKGGDFTAAMAFQIAATNLVVELGILMWLLIAWQFAAAEFIGGSLMVIVLAIIFRLFVSDALKRRATCEAGENATGTSTDHPAGTDSGSRDWKSRLTSWRTWVSISHTYVMNWSMLWRDIGIGVLVAGALGACVPARIWQKFFFSGSPMLSMIWGALVGPLIAVASFTCSIGNVPLAAVLWKGGLSFGGVASFMFGDLIILPILNIYRKSYGTRMTGVLAAVLYVSMVAAALTVEALFALLSWTPQHRPATAIQTTIGFNYTTVLDLISGAVLVFLFVVHRRTAQQATRN